MAVGPRVRHAIRLLSSGIVKTKKEAAEAVGIAPSYFYAATNGNSGKPDALDLMDEIEMAMATRMMDTGAAMEVMGREALLVIRSKMLDSDNEAIQLKAAIDLADRSPETTKIHKHQVEAIHMSAEDSKALAAALVAGARTRERYGIEVQSDYVKVPIEQSTLPTEDTEHASRRQAVLKAPVEGTGQASEGSTAEEHAA